jgi:hypothetical protein
MLSPLVIRLLWLYYTGPAEDEVGEAADIMAAVRLVKQRDAAVQGLMPVRRCMQ